MGQIGRTVLKAFFETGDVPTEAQYIDFIDSVLNLTDDTILKRSISATLAIPFSTALITKIDPLTITGATNFTVNVTNAEFGNMTFIRVTADGTNAPTFDNLFQKLKTSRDYDNTSDVINLIAFWFDGISYLYSIDQPTAIPPPTITSMSVEDANPNDLVVVFNEPVTATNLGYTFRVDAVGRTLSAISGSGTDTLTFTISGAAIIAGPSLDLAYSSVTGDTLAVSATNVELVTFAATTDNVTNNVAAPFTNFDGITTYLDFGDILDSIINPAASVVEFEFEAKNQVLGGRYWVKGSGADSSIAYETVISLASTKILFTLNENGAATDFSRFISDSVVDPTNLHKWTFKKDGTTVTMFRDDVLIASSLDASAGSWDGSTNNNTANLVFGCIEDTSQVRTAFIEGDFRNLRISVGGVDKIRVPDCSTGTDFSGEGNNGAFTA